MKNIKLYMFSYYSSKRNELLDKIQNCTLSYKQPLQVRNLSNIMKNENSQYCLIARNTNNIDGIMFYREAIYNYSYIINMIESHEGEIKPIGRALINELYNIAKEEGIEYIYIETPPNSNLFYDNLSNIDDIYVMSGILFFPLETVEGDMMENNMIFYLYKKNFFEYMLKIERDTVTLGRVTFYVNIMLGGYRTIDIDEIDCEPYLFEYLIVVLNNIATNNMIHKIIINQFEQYEDTLIKFHYDKPKLPCSNSFEKLCNTQQYIDRTILSYHK